MYDGESKLTSSSDDLYVAPEMVKIGDEVAEVYLPVFDEMNATLSRLINETNEALENVAEMSFRIQNGDLILTVGGENNG